MSTYATIQVEQSAFDQIQRQLVDAGYLIYPGADASGTPTIRLDGLAVQPANSTRDHDAVAEVASQVCRAVAELPDRNSPDDWPDAMLVTHEELRAIVLEALEAAGRVQQAEPVGEIYSHNCNSLGVVHAVVRFDGPFDPNDQHTWPAQGAKVYLAAPAERAPSPTVVELVDDTMVNVCGTGWDEPLTPRRFLAKGTRLQLAAPTAQEASKPVQAEAASPLTDCHREQYEWAFNGWEACKQECDRLRDELALATQPPAIPAAPAVQASGERGYMGSTPDGGFDDHDEPADPQPDLVRAVDDWFSQNTGLDGCSNKDVAELAALFYGVVYEGGRESVDDALAIVESFGPGIQGLNDTFARQVLLAAEVKRVRDLYAMAVIGRHQMRQALKTARDHISMDALRVSHCKDAEAIDAALAEQADK